MIKSLLDAKSATEIIPEAILEDEEETPEEAGKLSFFFISRCSCYQGKILRHFDFGARRESVDQIFALTLLLRVVKTRHSLENST